MTPVGNTEHRVYVRTEQEGDNKKKERREGEVNWKKDADKHLPSMCYTWAGASSSCQAFVSEQSRLWEQIDSYCVVYHLWCWTQKNQTSVSEPVTDLESMPNPNTDL